MLELLVQPYREQDQERADAFYALLTTYPNLEWIPLTLMIADRASQLRATNNLRAPNAVQAATALVDESTGFISNDPLFRRVDGLDVLILDDLLA
jgi:predicted nucleic acid-binding protein